METPRIHEGPKTSIQSSGHGFALPFYWIRSTKGQLSSAKGLGVQSGVWARACPARVVLLLIPFWLLAACRASAPVPTTDFELPVIDTTEDLRQVLDRAGVEVQDIGDLETEPFGVPGRLLRVGESRLQVFEFESRTARLQVSQAIAPDGLSVGNRVVTWPDRPNIWATGRLIIVYPGIDGGTLLLLTGLLGDAITFEPPSLDEPYPPAVSQAIRSLADDLDLPPGVIQVVGFEQVTWSDACLEMSEVEEICLPTNTPGWRVILSADGELYEMRTDLLGDQVRSRRSDPAP